MPILPELCVAFGFAVMAAVAVEIARGARRRGRRVRITIDIRE
jgi:hypothetical protein